MLTHAFKVRFNVGIHAKGEEEDTFEWIRKCSPVAKYITQIEFSIKNGWWVECVHPIEIGAHQMSELLFQTYKELSRKPWLKVCLPVS